MASGMFPRGPLEVTAKNQEVWCKYLFSKWKMIKRKGKSNELEAKASGKYKLIPNKIDWIVIIQYGVWDKL